jgi:hypothetical protein
MAVTGGRPGRQVDEHDSSGRRRPRISDRAYVGSRSPLSLSLLSLIVNFLLSACGPRILLPPTMREERNGEIYTEAVVVLSIDLP